MVYWQKIPRECFTENYEIRALSSVSGNFGRIWIVNNVEIQDKKGTKDK